MHRAAPVVPVVLAAACGSAPPPAPAPPPAEPKKVTRVPIETHDDEPEDGVTFVKTRGAMSEEAIKAGLEPHNEALAGCYTTKVGRRRWLGGHVVLKWDIKADGTVSSVKLVESNLGSWPVEKCLLDIAWSASFGKPSGGDADFTVPLDFSAKGGTQIWDDDQALRAVGGQLAQLDECPDRADKPDPKKKKLPKKAPPPPAEPGVPQRPERPPSNVTITLYVGPQGKPQSVGFASATSEVGAKWAACAEAAALAWRLPDPRGQIAKLAVRYKVE